MSGALDEFDLNVLYNTKGVEIIETEAPIVIAEPTYDTPSEELAATLKQVVQFEMHDDHVTLMHRYGKLRHMMSSGELDMGNS